jgi:hypothetical protein
MPLTFESPVMRSTKGSMGALISSVSSTKPAVQNTIMALTTWREMTGAHESLCVLGMMACWMLDAM